MKLVVIDTQKIIDWDTFHTLFAETFGFPEYYGRNMDAWIDVISDLDDLVVLQLDQVVDFRKRCPEIYDATIECSAFVNWRNIDAGTPPVLILSFHQ